MSSFVPASRPVGTSRRASPAAARPPLSIRVRFALVTGVAGVLFGLLLTGLLQLRTEARTRASVRAALNQSARQVAGRLSGDLVARQHELFLIADLLRVGVVGDPAALRDALDGLAQRERTYAWIGFADPRGTVVASSRGMLQGRDVSQRPWFSGALRSPYFGDPHEAVMLAKELPAQGGEPLRFVDVALTVRDAHGVVRGVLGAHLHWRWVNEVIDAALADTDVAHRPEVLVADRNGNWLVRPAGEAAPTLAALLAAPGDFITGTARSDAAAPAEGLGWTVVVRMPSSRALAAMYADRGLFLLVSAVLAAVFSWLSWFVAGWVARPIERLAAAAQAFRAGDGAPFRPRLDGNVRETRALAEVMVGLVDEVQGLNADLSGRVEAQTAELRHAKVAAEDAARAKSAFLANMSHEIRTPMNGVLGLTHLLGRTALDVRQRDYLRKIQSSGQHLLGIINDVLDFSKIEADRLALEHIAFSLEDVLADAAGLLVDKAREKGLELVLDLDPALPARLRGDPLRIGQILINYLGNAVKFTERGEVVLSATLDDDGALVLAVRDTGVGLTAEQAGRLFRSFEQADASTTRRFGGTGLGLAICKRLAALMGGRVGVDSRPGEGATFRVVLPLEAVADAPAAPLAAPGAGRRVLLVDDNASARTAVARQLAARGFAVVEAADGEAAMAALAAGRVDAVLVDEGLPDGDGLALARRLGAGPAAGVPALLLSADPDREALHDEAARAGLAVLAKPVVPGRLAAALAAAFATKAAAVAAPAEPPSPAAGVARPAAAGVGVGPADAGLAGARVLLVEDNPINRLVATELLAQEGALVTFAVHGGEALARLREAPFDVVLMDMQMPVMDGVQATREIRADPALAAVPIVAMTADAIEADREHCLACGMDDFLAKPVDPAWLVAKVAAWRGRVSPQAAGAALPR